MFVAVVGCGHGEIDKIYEVVEKIEEKRGIKVSLVLCCGDFQSVRNMTDLRCMACPIKYQQMHDFHRYYSGEKTAPVPTVFIGGNHEASNYLQELPYGGWVAPNIYFLNTGIIRFGPLRIAGVSGIFKGHDYLRGRHECPPYDHGTMRSVYHYRNLDTFRLKQVKTHLDIVISHDWPKNIHIYGDTLALLRKKPFFRDEISNDNLGSRPLSELLQHLQPSYWFSAHMHVKFSAVVPHDPKTSNTLLLNDDSVKPIPKVTKFLALDKILPRRQFLQVIEFPDQEGREEEPMLHYDPEWLAILKITNHLVSVKPNTCYMPGPNASQSRFDYTPTGDEIEEVLVAFNRQLEIPSNFTQTAPCFEPGEHPGTAYPIANPHTTEFCEKLSISDPIRLLPAYTNGLGNSGRQDGPSAEAYRDYSNSEGWDEVVTPNTTESTSFTRASFNPDEISLEDEDEEGGDGGNKTADSFTSIPPPSFPQRRKLNLPPPHQFSGNEKLETNDDQKELECLQFLGGGATDVKFDDETPFFVLDTTGEPAVKKRRNASMYQEIEDSDPN